MFGAKANSKKNEIDSSGVVALEVSVIPPIFYGGNDPDIYATSLQKPVAAQKIAEKQEAVKEKEPPQNTAPFPKRIPPAPLQMESTPSTPKPTLEEKPVRVLDQPAPVGTTKKTPLFLILLTGILVLGAIAGGVWYAFFRAEEPQVLEEEVELPPSIPAVPVFVPSLESVPPVSSTSTSSTLGLPEFGFVATSTIPKERSLPSFSFFTPRDSDSDTLSDAEEKLFGTDPEVWDTDGDGYYDGQEVFYLYSPKTFAPAKLIDGDIAQEYINPSFRYRVYYPSDWVFSALDERDNKQVIFSGIDGDYVEIKMYEKLKGETFPEWFGRIVSNERFSDMLESKNRFEVPVWRRKDGLVHYFETENAVFIMALYARETNMSEFPHVIDMMSQSFRPSKNTVVLPEQPVLPIVGVSSNNVAPSSTIEVPESEMR